MPGWNMDTFALLVVFVFAGGGAISAGCLAGFAMSDFFFWVRKQIRTYRTRQELLALQRDVEKERGKLTDDDRRLLRSEGGLNYSLRDKGRPSVGFSGSEQHNGRIFWR